MNCRTIVKAVWACAAFLALGLAAQAQIIPGAVALPDSITANRTLYADTVYQMVNTVKVGPGVTLTIQPGTLIYGNKNGTRSCLQIERNAKIYAVGTQSRPIIFTSAQPQGSKALGDWGGVILLGNAHTNNPGGTQVIEGGTNGIFGGTNDADSSGVMEYVRIEYAGIAFSPNNEINGLTFGGVGNKTVIDHIQVSYANDDSYESFGGAQNCKYLIAWSGIDDEWDTDNGYSGRLQFFFSMRDSSISDISTSNGMEADNDATGDLSTPISKPIVANATFVGPQTDTTTSVNALFGRLGHWRRATRYGLFNSVGTGWPEGIRIDGLLGDLDSIFVSGDCPQPTNFHIRNTVVTGRNAVATNASNQYLTVMLPSGSTSPETITNAKNWFNCSAMGNIYAGNHPSAGLTAVTQANLHSPDPRPTSSSPAVTGGTNYQDGMLASGNNFTFDSVSYRGAFSPNGPRWDSLWSNYNPHITSYIKHKAGWNLVGLANTPSNNSKDAIYRFNNGNAFKYSGGYQVENNLVAGRGYFIELTSDATVEQVGTTVALPQTVSVSAGWNIVSTGASVRATAANTTNSSGLTHGSFFGFDPQTGYFVATTLEPGKAYWVEVTSAGGGTLTFNQ